MKSPETAEDKWCSFRSTLVPFWALGIDIRINVIYTMRSWTCLISLMYLPGFTCVLFSLSWKTLKLSLSACFYCLSFSSSSFPPPWGQRGFLLEFGFSLICVHISIVSLFILLASSSVSDLLETILIGLMLNSLPKCFKTDARSLRMM